MQKVVIKIKVIYTNKPINAKKNEGFAGKKAITVISALIVCMVGIRIFCSPDRAGNFEDAVEAVAAVSEEKNGYCLPVSNAQVSSYYSVRKNPQDEEKYEFHRGIDLVPSEENQNIYAFDTGTVEDCGFDESYGNFIILSHENGVETLYAHCENLLAEKGQAVSCGQIIATVGESGDTTGRHLHFEIRVNGKTVNPLDYIDEKA